MSTVNRNNNEMIEEGIQYKFEDNNYYYCYYNCYHTNFNQKLKLNFIEFNQGLVGEISDFQVEYDKEIKIIKKFKDEVLEKYPIIKIPSCTIEVSVKLERFFRVMPRRKQFLLLKHITNSIDFVCKHSGLGINNFTAPNGILTLEKGIYITQVSVFEKDSFQRLLIDYLAPSGILSEDVTILRLFLK